MQSKAATIPDYLASLPEDRRTVVATLHDFMLKHLAKGFEAGMSYGMIGYAVPHRTYPNGYHCDPRQPLPFAGLASQKGHFSLYLMALYLNDKGEDDGWFQEAWAKTGKKLDMGKSCIRFKKLDDLALDVIAAALKRWTVDGYIATYEKLLGGSRSAGKKAAKKAPAKQAAKKSAASGSAKAAKPPAKKTAKKAAKKAAKKTAKK
ncbi:MAG: hypothetical protein RL398_2701 [Planctomycetota bacterium]|jgi:hypothetical protein